MKPTWLNKIDIELLDHYLLKNRIISSRIFSPFLIINVLVIVLIGYNFSDNDIALTWSLLSLMTLISLMILAIKLMNRKIQKDKVEKIAKLVTGKVTRLDDREKIKVVSRIATKIPNKIEYVVEVDNDKVYEVNSDVFEELQVGDTALLKFGKNSSIYLSLTKNKI